MKNFFCYRGCCNYAVTSYIKKRRHYRSFDKTCKPCKAGVFITSKDKVLLVQSKGQYWGPPKGSLKPGESIKEAALREVKEETGIDLKAEELNEIKVVKGSCHYYQIEMEELDVKVQTDIVDNDANGIGWFKIGCLVDLVQNGKIYINQHCVLLLKKMFGITISTHPGDCKINKCNLLKF
jgi:hypothetical protein